ncbi:MAG: DUF2723 domain-containing protein, partial [Chloroflexota bacterium]
DVLPGDSGEFQFAAPLLSIVHPTGYPLYLLIAKLFTLIPLGSVAYRVNLLSAVCAALAVGLFYLVALRMTQVLSPTSDVDLLTPNSQLPTSNRQLPTYSLRPPTSNVQLPISNHLAAIVAALTLAFTPTFWSQATVAEVYALNSLFVVTLLGLAMAVRWGRRGGEQRGAATWLWLALALGLALAHHRTTILLLPALAIYLFPFSGLRQVWLRATVLVLLPLALYLYTPLRYDATPYTRIVLDAQHIITTLDNTPSAFVVHALGVGFGGALRWDVVTWERLLATPERITSELTLVGRVLVTLGTLSLLWRRRWRLFALLIVSSICVIVFNAAYQIGDIADFYTPIFIIGAMLIANGIALVADGVARFANRLTPNTSRGLCILVWSLLLLLPVALFAQNFAAMQHHDDIRARWQALLASEPAAGAVLISNDRDEMTPLYYLQLVEGQRADLVPLFPLISPTLPHVVPLTEYALQTSRPVYFIKPMDGLDIKFRTQPQGLLVRVLGLQYTKPAVPLLRESAVVNFVGWSQAEIAMRDSQIIIALFWQAQGTARPDITTYVHVEDGDGKVVAQSDHRPGGDYYPPSQWAAGETVRDTHVITLPPNVPRGEYRLVAGAYLPNGGSVEGVGRIEVGYITLEK